VKNKQKMLPMAYYDLIDTFPEEGCAVCNRMLYEAHRFLDNLLYERTLNYDTQQGFRKRRGLCNEHCWQATGFMGSSLSLSILFAATLDEILSIMGGSSEEAADTRSGLAKMFGRSESNSRLADRLEPIGPCLVCEVLTEVEQRLLHTLSHYVSDLTLNEAFRHSQGLCLPHFRVILRQAPGPEQRAALIAVQHTAWTRLNAQLREFIDKNDYRRMREAVGSEAGTWRRAAGHLTGKMVFLE
jgi:hypothetical protein